MRLILSLIMLFLSFYASADKEYFHCKGVLDSYWMFDTEAIKSTSISPDRKSLARLRNIGAVDEFFDVEMSDEWFKVKTFLPGGMFADMEQIYFVNRNGKKSISRQNNSLFGIVEKEFDCARGIEGEDLNTFFLMNSELPSIKPEEELNIQFNNSEKNWN